MPTEYIQFGRTQRPYKTDSIPLNGMHSQAGAALIFQAGDSRSRRSRRRVAVVSAGRRLLLCKIRPAEAANLTGLMLKKSRVAFCLSPFFATRPLLRRERNRVDCGVHRSPVSSPLQTRGLGFVCSRRAILPRPLGESSPFSSVRSALQALWAYFLPCPMHWSVP